MLPNLDIHAFTDIRRAALNWLARRDHSCQEIAQKLQKKGYSAVESEIVIKELTEAGWINEKRFTENYIHWRKGKGYGPLRISAELQARGIQPEMIAEQLDIADNAWFLEVKRVWQKQFKGKLPIDFKMHAKQIRFLQYRGFTLEQIDSVLKNTEM